MNDCSSCPHRVELHPEYKDADWIDLPCASCVVIEPQNEGRTTHIHGREWMLDNRSQCADPDLRARFMFDRDVPSSSDRGTLLLRYLQLNEKERLHLRAQELCTQGDGVIVRFVREYTIREERMIAKVVVDRDWQPGDAAKDAEVTVQALSKQARLLAERVPSLRYLLCVKKTRVDSSDES